MAVCVRAGGPVGPPLFVSSFVRPSCLRVHRCGPFFESPFGEMNDLCCDVMLGLSLLLVWLTSQNFLCGLPSFFSLLSSGFFHPSFLPAVYPFSLGFSQIAFGNLLLFCCICPLLHFSSIFFSFSGCFHSSSAFGFSAQPLSPSIILLFFLFSLCLFLLFSETTTI